MSKKNGHYRQILIRGTNWIGDAIMTLPAISAIAHNFPNARLTVMSKSWASAVYSAHPQVSQTIADDEKGLLSRFRLSRRLCGKYDLAILFQNAFAAALSTALAQIPQRWGYARDGRGFLLNQAVKIGKAQKEAHEVFYYLDLLESLGLDAPYQAPQLELTAEAKLEADTLFQQSNFKTEDKALILAPGAAFGAAKRWPVEYFAQASKELLKHRPSPVLIMGGPSEKDVANELESLLKPERVLNLAGRTSLNTAMAIIQRGALMLTNDSGLMHLGGALGLPLVAAFGPTNPRTTAPLGLSRLIRSKAACAPCLKRACPLKRQICWDDVEPQKILAAALDLLNPSPALPGKSPAIFLDRDGTINREVSYLSNPNQLELIAGAGEAIANLKKASYKIIVVTNQSGVARGYFSEEDLDHIHKRLKDLLAAEGALIDGLYYCPHHPEGQEEKLATECSCRKPGDALFIKAAQEHNIDLARSFWVGDSLRDLSPAEKFGGRSVLLMSGHGLKEVKNITDYQPNLLAPNLRRAAQWILAQ